MTIPLPTPMTTDALTRHAVALDALINSQT